MHYYLTTSKVYSLCGVHSTHIDSCVYVSTSIDSIIWNSCGASKVLCAHLSILLTSTTHLHRLASTNLRNASAIFYSPRMPQTRNMLYSALCVTCIEHCAISFRGLIVHLFVVLDNVPLFRFIADLPTPLWHDVLIASCMVCPLGMKLP